MYNTHKLSEDLTQVQGLILPKKILKGDNQWQT